MAHEPTTAIFQPFTLSSTHAVAVVDSTSSRSVTVGTASVTTHWRTAFGLSGATGSSEASPKSLRSALQTALNAAPGAAFWVISLTVDGLVKIQYDGGTGAATITWTSTTLRDLFGFTGNLSFAAPGASQTATYLPVGCVAGFCRGGDQDWRPEPQAQGIGRMESGVVYVFRNSSRRMLRKFDLMYHPRLWADRYPVTSSKASPVYPDTKARMLAPTAVNVSAPPWSLLDFHSTAGGQRLAAFFGNFQSAVAQSATTYDAVYLSENALSEGEPVGLSVDNWNKLVDWRGVEFTLVAEETLSF